MAEEHGRIVYRAGGNPPVSPGLFIAKEGGGYERVAFVPADVRPEELEPHIERVREMRAEKGGIVGRCEIGALVKGDQRVAP